MLRACRFVNSFVADLNLRAAREALERQVRAVRSFDLDVPRLRAVLGLELLVLGRVAVAGRVDDALLELAVLLLGTGLTAPGAARSATAGLAYKPPTSGDTSAATKRT